MPAWIGASEVRTELWRAGNPQWFDYVGLDLTIVTRLGTTVVPRSGDLFASTASRLFKYLYRNSTAVEYCYSSTMYEYRYRTFVVP